MTLWEVFKNEEVRNLCTGDMDSTARFPNIHWDQYLISRMGRVWWRQMRFSVMERLFSSQRRSTWRFLQELIRYWKMDETRKNMLKQTEIRQMLWDDNEKLLIMCFDLNNYKSAQKGKQINLFIKLNVILLKSWTNSNKVSIKSECIFPGSLYLYQVADLRVALGIGR